MSYTHGHAIMNLLLLRRGQAAYWLPIVLGGMFPDLMLLIFILYQLSIGESSQRMFEEVYFEQKWQIVFGFFHGFFTYFTTIIICASLLKCTGDLPLALAQSNISNNIISSKSNTEEESDVQVDGDIEAHDATPIAMSATDGIVGVNPADNNSNNNDEEITDNAKKRCLPLTPVEGNINSNSNNTNCNKEVEGIEVDDDALATAVSTTGITDDTISVNNIINNNNGIEDHTEKHWSYHWLVGTIYFASSAFLHTLFDFFVHHDDGHESFVPFSIWKFRSPVSYWDIHHFSWIVFPIETAAVVYSCIFIWREYRRSKGKRACLTGTTIGIVLITYILMFIMCILQTVNYYFYGDNDLEYHNYL